MAEAICPSCGEDIQLTGKVQLGQEVVCPHCETELEVIDLDPVELDWIDDEDWDDWDDWDEEEEEEEEDEDY